MLSRADGVGVEAGLMMEQQSLHRGINSICLLTWDIRNVMQPQQLCACQGHWQGGAGPEGLVTPGPQKLPCSRCSYQSKKPSSELCYAQGLLRAWGVSLAISWSPILSLFCLVLSL